MEKRPVMSAERVGVHWASTLKLSKRVPSPVRRGRTAQDAAAIDPQLPIAEVVRENEDDIGFRSSRGLSRSSPALRRRKQTRCCESGPRQEYAAAVNVPLRWLGHLTIDACGIFNDDATLIRNFRLFLPIIPYRRAGVTPAE